MIELYHPHCNSITNLQVCEHRVIYLRHMHEPRQLSRQIYKHPKILNALDNPRVVLADLKMTINFNPFVCLLFDDNVCSDSLRIPFKLSCGMIAVAFLREN